MKKLLIAMCVMMFSTLAYSESFDFYASANAHKVYVELSLFEDENKSDALTYALGCSKNNLSFEVRYNNLEAKSRIVETKYYVSTLVLDQYLGSYFKYRISEDVVSPVVIVGYTKIKGYIQMDVNAIAWKIKDQVTDSSYGVGLSALYEDHEFDVTYMNVISTSEYSMTSINAGYTFYF